MSDPPVVDFGAPTIFFDSHPEEQDTWISSYWTSLKQTLKIAFTGEVPRFHEPGKLRLIWWTHEGTQGMKDYELHQYGLVRDNFDVLLAMPEVRRAMVMGYSGQNPYVLGDRGTNPWVERFERDWKRTGREEKKGGAGGGASGSESGVDWEGKAKERMDASKEGRIGQVVDIEAIIEKNDEIEEEKRRAEEARIASENEGLLSGEMV